MTSYNMSSFFDELEKIASVQPVSRKQLWVDASDRGAVSSAIDSVLEKTAARGALVGAGIGAGLSALQGGMKEWDERLNEDKLNLLPVQTEVLRKRRAKRIAAGIALGAAGGAAAGHFGGKAIKAVGSEAKRVADHAGGVLDKSITRLTDGMKETSMLHHPEKAKALSRQVGEAFREGATPSLLKRDPNKKSLVSRLFGRKKT